jgi:hypothetical protein
MVFIMKFIIRFFGLHSQDDRESESMLIITLFVILSEAKNLMLLLNFSPDVLIIRSFGLMSSG